MKILLITHYYAPENGAPQRRWSALVGRLTAMGHSVDVLCPPPHYPHGRLEARHRADYAKGTVNLDEAGARVFRVSFLPHDGRLHTRTLDHLWVALDSVRRARRLIRDGVIAPDVVVATAPALESLIAGRLIARQYGLPLVAEMRDAWPDLVAYTPGLSASSSPVARLKRCIHEFVTRLQRGADAVVTTTATFATVLEARGIQDVTVLRNATEVARYDSLDKTVRLEAQVLRVLYMGTIGRSQGLDKVVEALARLRADGVRVDARIVGQGADVTRLRRLNKRLGAPAVILGQIDGHEVVQQYQWADSTIVSLRSWEPFSWTVPSKLYELLAAGKHISAIVDGEAADIIRETDAGDVVSPGDVSALVTMWRQLGEDRSRLEVSPTGRCWVEEHADYDRIAAEYETVLLRAVRGRWAAG